MTIAEIVNVYNAMVLDFFAGTNTLVNTGAVLTDTDKLEFKDKGQSADILIPSALTVHDFDGTSDVVKQEPELAKKTITLDTLKDVTFTIPSSVMGAANRFDLLSKFAREASRAIAKDVDTAIALEYANAGSTIGDGSTGWTEDLVLSARKSFNAASAFEENRFIVCKDDTSFYKTGMISAKDKVVVVDGGNVRSIKDIPEYAGFRIITSPYIQTVDSKNRDLVVQENGIIFVNRPLEKENSNTIEMSVLEQNGITMRTTYWYDPNKKQKVLSTDILYAVQTIEDSLVIEAQIAP